MPELTVAAGLARGLVELAVSKGADRAALLERAAITAADLQDQDNRIPFARYVALMRAGKALTADPALALHYGELNDLSEISVVGLIGNASGTMIEAFAQLARYGRLVVEVDGPSPRLQVRWRGAEAWLVDTRENPNDFPELTESTFARLICGPRGFGVTQLVKAVRVTHPAPAYRDEYERIYGAPVTFDADENAMLVDPVWFNHRVQLQPRYAFGVLSEHADALLRSLQESKSMRGRVESLLMPVLHTGEAAMAQVAGQLGVSRQTLFRKLKAEGTTFERVLDALRHRLAVHYLKGRKVSVNETAYLVGFSDPAAFSRAFKRWTGVSPRDFRQSG
ncbi:MAG: AraC family transcriptional regulator [Caulobacter sp.]|nr:AraC family transcriptional regulator [Caulobacter sp.]